MSLHSSLRVDKAGAAQRSVLTRIERIKEIMKKGQWSDESSVVNLPKVKKVRVKAGKKKAKEAPADAAKPGAKSAAGAGAGAGAAKPAGKK
ncbi:MAG: small basic protein [Candidatus Omnitrophota bacterium]